MLFYFYGRNTQELSLYCGRLYPRWFRLGALEILSISDGNSCNSSGSVDNNGSISLLFALVDYLSFDLEASLKHPCCCACSLKGIADKTSFEVFREEDDTGNLFWARFPYHVQLLFHCYTPLQICLCAPVLLKQNWKICGKEENKP